MQTDIIWTGATLGLAALSAAWDLRTGRIPNGLTLGGLALALTAHGALGGWHALARAAAAAMLCGAVPWLLFRRDGLGGGDVKLFAALGALLGMRSGLELQWLAFCLVSVYGLGLLLWRGRLWQSLGSALGMNRHGPREHRPEATLTEIPMGGAIFAAAYAVCLGRLGLMP